MANPRKQIILNEILFWKQHKLLPEHYCDYLITLYTEGNESEEATYKKSIKAKEQWNKVALITLVIALSILLLVAIIYITDLLWLVGPIIGIIALTFMYSAFKFAKKNHLLAPVLQTAAALLLFGLSVKVSLTYFNSNIFILYALLILNCIIWVLTGLKLKIHYFSIAGILGIIVLIGYYLYLIY